ncbi:MAG: XDD4 family exosortase-dependent surface protein [Fimbriimonadales bacterium]
MTQKVHRILPAAVLGALATSGHAWTAIYTGSSVSGITGNALSVQATFQTRQTGSQWFLDVTLTNTSNDVSGLKPADILTGLFWTLPNPVALAPVSASRNGSVVWQSGSILAGVPNDVGGEWAYQSGLNYASTTGVFGVSAAGLGLFGPGDRFNPSQNLNGPVGVGGLEYGILPNLASWPSDANAPVAAAPLVSNSVTFVFSTGGSELSALPTNVWGQYGTGLYEPSLQLTGGSVQPQGVPVPEPVTVGLGAGVLAAAALRRRRR